MYRPPSRRRSTKETSKPNLTPILDAVFIFLFFLMMSASFLQVYEIGSEVPVVSTSKPPKSAKKELALTLKLTSKGYSIYTGIPSKFYKRVPIRKKEYNYTALRQELIKIKKRNVNEKTIIIEPIVDVDYETIVKTMDAVRMLDKTDEAIYKKDKDGLDAKVNELFSNIVFGNIQS